MPAPTSAPPAPAVAASDPYRPLPFEVVKTRPESGLVTTLWLEPREAEIVGRPGQFNMLYLFGVGEVAISISSASKPGETLQHSIAAVGSVTRPMAQLRKGQQLGIRGPYGRGWPLEEARGKDVVVVAGGLGLAPLRPALYHLLVHRKDYERVTLLYGARSPSEQIFKAELKKWGGHKDLNFLATVDRSEPGWEGHVGVVTTLLKLARPHFDPDNTLAIVCGPEIMMRFTCRELEKCGVPDAGIHLSLERNMKCAVGFCGHCQMGPHFLCRDGPVFNLPQVIDYLYLREF